MIFFLQIYNKETIVIANVHEKVFPTNSNDESLMLNHVGNNMRQRLFIKNR